MKTVKIYIDSKRINYSNTCVICGKQVGLFEDICYRCLTTKKIKK